MRRMIVVCAVVLGTVPALAGVRGYYRFPAIHGDTVVFTAEGDLWTAGVEGGVARRLTTHLAEESHAVVAPDGTTVAFAAAYEGPTEVYTMPLAGGVPTRRSFEGGPSYPVGWSGDGRLLYTTFQRSTLPEAQLVAVDLSSGGHEVLPLAQASDGCTDPTGSRLFFTRLPFQGSHTKRYRGGMAQQIWRFDAGAAEARPLTADFAGTSKTPMWWDGRIVFVSDRDGTMNLWSMNPDGTDLRQLTHHDGWDVSSPTLSDGRVAYQLGADLRLYDIASATDTAIDVTLASDFDQLRERWIEKPMDYLTAAGLSPSGDRVVLTARGQVFVAPVKQGRLVEASRRPGVRYRDASFLPGGARIAVLSDESGETEWWTLPANGVGEPQRVTRDAAVLRFGGVPSPDGRHLAYDDKNLDLWVLDLETGESVKVASSPHWGFDGLAWSPDGGWLAFVVPGSNTLDRILLYEVETGTTVPLTSERTHSFAPAWSPDGRWIYFLSDRHLATAVPSPWGVYQPEPFYASPTGVFAVALAPGERFPFRPDDELAPAKQSEARSAAAEGERPDGASGVTVKVVVDGLSGRLYQVPVEPGDYASLVAGKDRLYWLSSEAGERDGRLQALPVTNRDPKPKTLVGGVRGFELSADGSKVLAHRRDALLVFDAGADTVDAGTARVDLSGWSFPLDPTEELHQMFVEAWRLERDYFYDRGMNGVDWQEVREKYAPLVDRVTDRRELSDVLAQMVSELSALHIFVRGGDVREGQDVGTGALGAVLERDAKAGGWRVKHVWQGDPDYPDELSPLARPGVDVVEGDVIRLIDGVATADVSDPAVLLRNRAGKQVLLRVAPAAGGGPRDVVVVPITHRAEANLRYTEWELTRRQRVEDASQGRIGYVHMRAMTGRNWEEWARAFYPVFDRQGLIVDVRHNRGGNIDSWVLEKLLRRAWFYWQPRAGEPYWNMQYAFRGHVVVLVDQRTASDGEAFAEGFRRLGLGAVIGMRTWGGEIWLSSSNVLVDKGIATAAETGVYGPEGSWLIEGWGVEPDIVVDNLPHATFNGDDAQLDAAIEHLERLIAEEPAPIPPAPPYPARAPAAVPGS